MRTKYQQGQHINSLAEFVVSVLDKNDNVFYQRTVSNGSVLHSSFVEQWPLRHIRNLISQGRLYYAVPLPTSKEVR